MFLYAVKGSWPTFPILEDSRHITWHYSYHHSCPGFYRHSLWANGTGSIPSGIICVHDQTSDTLTTGLSYTLVYEKYAFHKCNITMLWACGMEVVWQYTLDVMLLIIFGNVTNLGYLIFHNCGYVFFTAAAECADNFGLFNISSSMSLRNPLILGDCGKMSNCTYAIHIDIHDLNLPINEIAELFSIHDIAML